MILALLAQLDYWGLQPSAWFTMEGWGKDSLFSGDTSSWAIYDSASFGDTLRLGDTLGIYSERFAVFDYDTAADTVQEADTVRALDPWLLITFEMGDTVRLSTWLKTPPSVGESWDLSLGGYYPVDLNGDSIADSMVIDLDTAAVLEEGEVSVPAGSFDAFKIEYYFYGWAYFKDSSGATTDSAFFERWQTQWWAPGVGLVKDSAYQEYTFFIYGNPVKIYFFWSVKELVRWWDVHEEAAEPKPRVEAFPGGIRVLAEEPFEVYSASGRLVARGVGERVIHLRRGVYFVRLRGARVKALVP